MAMRIPRGYALNRPQFREVCEGARPNSQAVARLPFTGLPHVRVDEVTQDPFAFDPGTIVGIITGNYIGSGTFAPAMCNGTGSAAFQSGMFRIYGTTEASTAWGLPGSSSGDLSCGQIKPLGVIFSPVYHPILTTAFTNYKRQHSIAFLTEYVIQVPAITDEETVIEAGDVVMVGTGNHLGLGWSSPFATHRPAGRYAKFDNIGATTAQYGNCVERIVGRCLKKTYLGYGNSSVSTGDLLSASLSNFTASADVLAEWSGLDQVESVPGLGLSGAATKGVPAFLLGARADSSKRFYALTILIRL